MISESVSAVKDGAGSEANLASEPIFVYGMSAAAAAVTVVCVCLIGHHHSRSDSRQYGGGLLHLTHSLRLPFYLVTEALKRHKSASSLIEAVALLDAGVAAALGATSLQKSILLVYKTWTSEMPAAVDLRWTATACLGAPLVLSFLLAMGLLVHGVMWADHPLVSRKVMEHHSGAIAGLCLLSMMSMKLLPLMPWTDDKGGFLHVLHTDYGGMPGQVTFDIFLLGVVISTAPAFAIALVYTIRIETSFEAYYLTVFYGLELAHTLLSKGIFRLSKCSCAARTAAVELQQVPPTTPAPEDDLGCNQTRAGVEPSQDRSSRIVGSHEDDLGASAVGIDHSTVEVAEVPLSSPPVSSGPLARAREAKRRSKHTGSPTSATMEKRAGEASATGDLDCESTQAHAELATSHFNAMRQLQMKELRIIEMDAQERRREEEARARMALGALEKRTFLALHALEQRAAVQEQQAGALGAQGSSCHQESNVGLGARLLHRRRRRVRTAGCSVLTSTPALVRAMGARRWPRQRPRRWPRRLLLCCIERPPHSHQRPLRSSHHPQLNYLRSQRERLRCCLNPRVLNRRWLRPQWGHNRRSPRNPRPLPPPLPAGVRPPIRPPMPAIP